MPWHTMGNQVLQTRDNDSFPLQKWKLFMLGKKIDFQKYSST